MRSKKADSRRERNAFADISPALVCDIGNTSIKFGICGSGGEMATYALPAPANTGSATADSLGLQIVAMLEHAGVEPARIEACVAASVVPPLNSSLRQAASRYLGCPTLFAPGDLPIPLENRYERPEEVGADRLVGAWAATRLFPDAPALIVVDFGTAATFDCVADNAYLGGLIFPGPATAAAALAAHTARLPHIDFQDETSRNGSLSPCRDTATSIRDGILFGYAALVEGLCARLAAKLPGQPKIVAAGGFAATLGHLTNIFDIIMPGLILNGLCMLHFKQETGKCPASCGSRS